MDNSALQSVFDKACQGVIRQGKKSFDPNNGKCRYRLIKDGECLKCAIGHLLSDEQIEKYGVQEGYASSKFPDALIDELFPGVELFTFTAVSGMSFTVSHFLFKLQQAHDDALTQSSLFIESFKKRANEVAEDFGLKPIK